MGKKIYVLGVFLLLAVFAVGCSSGQEKSGSSLDQGEKIEIKFSHVAGPKTPKGLAAERFAELAAEYTNGQVEVKVYPSSSLYGDGEEFEALQANNVQMIAPSAGKLVAFNPKFQLPDLPFLFNDEEASNRFWDGQGGQKLFKELESQGLIGLASWPNGMRQWMNGKVLIKTPDDIKGLKFRVPSGGVLTKIHEVLGAGAVGMPFADVYTALQQGTVDGTVASLDNIKTERYYETIKYLTIANLNSLNYVVLTNADFWNGLPEDVRTQLEKALAEATEYERQVSGENNSLNGEIAKMLTEEGVEIYELTNEQKEAFRQVLKPLYDEFTSVIGADLIEMAKQANH